MATYNLAVGAAGFPASMLGDHYRMEWKLDLSGITTALAQNDIIQIANIPANMNIQRAWLKTVTPCSAAMTASLGDTADATSWCTSAALNAAAGSLSTPNGTGVTTAGKTYTAADFILLKITSAVVSNTGVFTVVADAMRV